MVSTTATRTPESAQYYGPRVQSLKSLRIPVSLPSICVRKGRRVAEVTAISPDVTGLIVLLSSIASRRAIDLLGGSVVKAPDGRVVVSLFVDYTDSGLSAEAIEYSLGGMGVVEGLSVNGALPGGVVVNRHLFPLLMGDNRAVAFSLEHYCGMMSYLKEMLGEAANTLFYDMGRKYGTLFTKQVREETGLTADELVQVVLAEAQASGWCMVEGYASDRRKMSWRIVVKDLFECKKKCMDGVNRSHFFRGFISGLIGEAFGVENVSCLETICASNFADACEFAAWV